MSGLFFPRSIGRLSWMCRVFLGVAIVALELVATRTTSPLRRYVPPMVLEILSWALIIAVIVYAVWFIHLPRARSLGLPGRFLFLILLPPLNTLLGMMFLLGGEGYWTRLTRKNQSRSTDESL